VRAFDFTFEDSEDDGSGIANNIVTALSLIQKKIKQGDLKSIQPTQFVIRLIRNTGLNTFTYQDLVTANQALPSIQNIIKQITPEQITFSSGVESPVTNADETNGVVNNPEQTVSNMAKSAMKRRQK
jgi:hypothetical protein